MNSIISFIVQTIPICMVFLLGATGETITEKSGHLNMGIPGIMCVGAASGFLAEVKYVKAVGTENVVPMWAILLPILVTVLCGVLMGTIYCFLTVTLRVNQNVTGLALTTFGVGTATYMISTLGGADCSFASKFFTAGIPGLKNWGWFGELFFSHGILVYLAIAIALIAAFVLRKTRVGLHLRAVGENPATADAAGINVTSYRYLSTLIGSGIAALGGLCYVMDYLGGNWEYEIEQIGWIAVALVIFTVWRPDVGIIGSIIFGVLKGAGRYIHGVVNANLLSMLPFVITIIVLIVTSIRDRKEDRPPEGLGQNYYREER